MRVLVAGSSGLIGSSLVHYLTSQGHTVQRLVRAKVSVNDKTIFWDPYGKAVDLKDLEGFDAVVNLAGENIASGRWTEAKKKAIRDSRIVTTSYLSELLAKLERPPKIFVCASAIGYYGSRNHEMLNEDSLPGNGFLAKVCQRWEAATNRAVEKGIRVVNLRIGVVLTKEGGALSKMLIPFRLGLGGPVGSGNQFMSWISLEDLVRVIEYAIGHDTLQGPVNTVAPESVTNRVFSKKLADQLHRPCILPFPAFAVKILLGEMGEELLLSSTRVLPKKLEKEGFTFKYPDLSSFLSNCL